ncbi:MAG TPA: CBS domain-containing protein [Actinomycetota bacterium]|nr:CBS domain-containing protein [Actinomycetota bacterium]
MAGIGGAMTAVREVMSTELVIVDPSVIVTEAARVMSTHRAGSVLVLDEGSLVGIFTERDILRALAHYAKADEARVSPVSRWMTPGPVTIGPDATSGEALDVMLSGGFRHLPVLEGDNLVGIVSMRDLARSISKG